MGVWAASGSGWRAIPRAAREEGSPRQAWMERIFVGVTDTFVLTVL